MRVLRRRTGEKGRANKREVAGEAQLRAPELLRSIYGRFLSFPPSLCLGRVKRGGGEGTDPNALFGARSSDRIGPRPPRTSPRSATCPPGGAPEGNRPASRSVSRARRRGKVCASYAHPITSAPDTGDRHLTTKPRPSVSA